MLIEEVEQKIEEVLEKDFKTSLVGGYKKKDVDIFLDELVEFYEHIASRLTATENEGDGVIKENLRLKNQIIKLEQQMAELRKSKEFDQIVLKQKIADLSMEIAKIRGIH